MKRGSIMTLMSLMLAALVALAGCGGIGGSGAGAKTLTVVGGTDIQSLDIHKVSDSPSFTVLEHINETLFRINEKGEISPLLAAEPIRWSADAKTATIKLRSGVKFSDGAAFNAAVVKQNLDRIVAEKGTFAFLLGQVAEVKVVDDLTVELLLKAPYAPLQFVLGHGFSAMVSPNHLAKGAAAFDTMTVGTGPYKLKEWKKGEAVFLTRNDEYWGTKGKTEELVFKMVKEDGPRMIEVESGNADVAVRVPPSEIERLQKDKNLSIDITPGLRTIFIYMNVSKAPLDNVKLRQAINYAVDKDAIVKNVLNNMGRVSDAPIAPAIFGYKAQTPYKADKAKAKQLLAEAGYANGLTLELLHPTGRYPQDARIAEAVAAQLKEVGITVKLTTMEWAQYIPFTAKPQAENTVQMAMLGWSTPTMDADYGLYSLFHKSVQAPNGFNRGFYDNATVNQLLDDARSTGDTKKRQELYASAIKQIWEDAPWLFLHSEIQVTAIRKGVTGFQVHPSERLIAVSAVKK